MVEHPFLNVSPAHAGTMMPEIQSEAEKQHLIAGVLCLNFANTLYGHGRTPIHEYLSRYSDLVVWSRRLGILSEDAAAYLIRLAARQPSEAWSVFHRAIALRETIFRIFTALADGQSPKAPDLSAINVARTQALAHSLIAAKPPGFSVAWDDAAALDQMLWPIALSATDLLTATNLNRVRHCGGCDWLFLDTSRNHLRRWCSMSECGNRAKARRFLARKRKRASTR
jgi:predicted RNA-binding Zn ribbon-like protein